MWHAPKNSTAFRRMKNCFHEGSLTETEQELKQQRKKNESLRKVNYSLKK